VLRILKIMAEIRADEQSLGDAFAPAKLGD